MRSAILFSCNQNRDGALGLGVWSSAAAEGNADVISDESVIGGIGSGNASCGTDAVGALVSCVMSPTVSPTRMSVASSWSMCRATLPAFFPRDLFRGSPVVSFTGWVSACSPPMPKSA